MCEGSGSAAHPQPHCLRVQRESSLTSRQSGHGRNPVGQLLRPLLWKEAGVLATGWPQAEPLRLLVRGHQGMGLLRTQHLSLPSTSPRSDAEVASAHGLLKARVPSRRASLGQLSFQCPESRHLHPRRPPSFQAQLADSFHQTLPSQG